MRESCLYRRSWARKSAKFVQIFPHLNRYMPIFWLSAAPSTSLAVKKLVLGDLEQSCNIQEKLDGDTL